MLPKNKHIIQNIPYIFLKICIFLKHGDLDENIFRKKLFIFLRF